MRDNYVINCCFLWKFSLGEDMLSLLLSQLGQLKLGN